MRLRRTSAALGLLLVAYAPLPLSAEPRLLLRFTYTLSAPEWFGPNIYGDALIYRDGSVVWSIADDVGATEQLRAPANAAAFAEFRRALAVNRVATQSGDCGKIAMPIAHLYDGEGTLTYVRRVRPPNSFSVGGFGDQCPPQVQEIMLAVWHYLALATSAPPAQDTE